MNLVEQFVSMTTSKFDSSSTDARARELLSRMTLQEKLGQLTQFSGDEATGPDDIRVDKNELAASGGIGSVLNVRGAQATNDLQRVAVEKSRLGIPILFGHDIIHGLRTVYPTPLGLSASWNPTLAEECARMAAVEARAEGLRWTFSPMVDIGRDARWGRVTEGSGEDTYLGAKMAAAWVRGYQGTDLAAPDSLLACAKHFLGYGAVEGGREYDSVDVSERVLREVHLPPFKAALDAGVGTFMSSFNTLQGIPASANRWILSEILRDEWGFSGFVVSDWDSIGELIKHGVAIDGYEAARKALFAGVDMDMQSNLYATKGAELVSSGKLDIALVDQAVLRVLNVKFALGLFENPYTLETDQFIPAMPLDHLVIARKAAEESFVLLKNAPVAGKPLLPLNSKQKIAVIGPLADSKKDMYGAWASGINAETLRETLATRLGSNLLYSRGADFDSDSTDETFSDALSIAAAADIVLMALGERGNMSGEANSRSNIELSSRQLALLKAVVAIGKPVVLLLFCGRPLAIPWEAENLSTILCAWFPGSAAGPALARVLYGDVNPSGKLTASFPRSVGQMPLYYNMLNTGRPILDKKPGDGFISGYVDQYSTALFPFGWGLSYAHFSYSPTEILTKRTSVAELDAEGAIVARASITNTSAVEGTEVVQLYIRQRGTSIARPIRELKGFSRVAIAPGKTKTIEFSLTKDELSFWDDRMQFVVEPTELTVWIAPNSVSGEPAVIKIDP